MSDRTITELQSDLDALVPLAKLGLVAMDGADDLNRVDAFIEAGLLTGEHIKGKGWVESEATTRAREVLGRLG